MLISCPYRGLLLRTATSVPLIKEPIINTKNLYQYQNVCKNGNGEPGKYTYFEQSTSLHSSYFELVKWYSKHTNYCHSHTSCVILFDLFCLKSMFTQITFRPGFNLQNTKYLQTTYFFFFADFVCSVLFYTYTTTGPFDRHTAMKWKWNTIEPS